MGPALKAVLPDRFREAFGLQHMKVYLFDDDLILSGANLNTDYFVNRQDRYVMFGNCLDLAEYYAGLVRAVSSLSYRLNANGMVLPSATPDPGRQSAKFVRFSKGHLESFLREWADKTRPVRDRLRRTPETDGVSDKEDTLVVPFFQQGQFGLDEDERMITSLLTHFIDNSRHPWRVHFTSGYLNFAHGFRQLLLAQTSSTKYNILTASPEVAQAHHPCDFTLTDIFLGQWVVRVPRCFALYPRRVPHVGAKHHSPNRRVSSDGSDPSIGMV